MSLTDWVSWDRHLIDILFDKPPLNLREELKVIPLTKNYGTVGTAFDYAIRLQIACINADLVGDFPLVAEHGVRGNRKRKEFIANFHQKRTNFINNKLALHDLLPDCLILAKMEAVFRSGRDFPDSDIFSVNEADMLEVKTLSSEEAVEYGLVHAIKTELMPKGVQVTFIGQ